MNRRELLKTSAGASLVAGALGPALATADAQGTAKTGFPGVDMSHEATAVDPAHYHVEFENEFVRVLRCRIPGHEKVKMHNHPVGSVIIFMTDQNLHQTLENGTTEEARNKAGVVLWGPGTQSQHMGENITDQMYEYVRVEVKSAIPKRA